MHISLSNEHYSAIKKELLQTGLTTCDKTDRPVIVGRASGTRIYEVFPNQEIVGFEIQADLSQKHITRAVRWSEPMNDWIAI